MNKMTKYILIMFVVGLTSAMAFESQFALPVNTVKLKDSLSVNSFTANPATMQFEKNTEYYRVITQFANNSYKRMYDPSATQRFQAEYATMRRINNKSFFLTSISYDKFILKNMFASMEKDFYDDYFSMIDSTLGNTTYYGPQLQILYNYKLSDNLFLGVEGSYGVERGLKDTFPKTITIMRNSEYKLGLDYRKKSFEMGLHGRYYDDQTYYEAVKSYSDVVTKTYLGYNTFYNEISSATIKKRRIRNGLDYGAHLRLGGQKAFSVVLRATGLGRISKANLIRSSKTIERGFWQRKGVQLFSSINVHPNDAPITLKMYADYLHFSDWGESLISNALVLENEESYTHAGAVMEYNPSFILKASIGGEAGKVAYDYVEYVFPFSDTRSGMEWNMFCGVELYLSSKTKLNFNLEYGKEVPKFYWNTDYFKRIRAIINLEQLFSFGYIDFTFENVNKKPSNGSQSISVMQFGLSYRKK